MVSTKNTVLAVLILAAGLAAFALFYNSDEAKIKRQFKALSSALSLEPGESQLQAAAKAMKIAQMLADPCTVSIPTYDIATAIARADAQTHIMLGRSRFSRLSVAFHDMTVFVREKGLAEVTVTVYVSASTEGAPLEDDVFEVRCNLEKINGEWLFAAFNEVVVLEK